MRVYLSPSQQEHNIGVGAYGSESRRCQDIADRTRKLLVAAGVEVKQTPKSWEPLGGTEWLAKVVAASNAYGADAHVCIHTNAASSGATHGTDTWHFPGSAKGKALTEQIYKRVIKVSGKGNGIHTQPVFYETKNARAPVCYIELAYHTNKEDVKSIIARPDAYARAIAEGICEWAGVEPPEVKPAPPVVEATVTKGQRPVLKQQLLKYALLNGVSFVGCEHIALVNPDGTLNYQWGEAARTLAWRVSVKLGVEQTTQPTVALLRALKG